ncbi:MAG: amidohydrolase family protein [Chloroflexi bacterium]|nr:amidohydrolase family protein [Chloroflexota bacterium]
MPLKLMDAYRRTPFGQSTSYLWESSAFSNPEEHVGLMDEVGVDAELLGYTSAFIGAIKAAGMDVGEGVKFANDECARVVRDYPGRFVGSAAINPFDVRFSLAEIERGITRLGFKAISMVACYDGLYVDDEQFWPIFKLAEELDVPVYVHPASPVPYWKEAQKADKEYLRDEIGMLLTSTICAGRFIMFGIYDRFPRLNVVFGLLAGYIPFMFGRFDNLYGFYSHFPPEVVKDATVFPLRYARDYKGRIMGDTHSVDSQALECAVETLGADCIFFGGDFPVTPADFGVRYDLEQVLRMRISEGDRRKILGENAARLLKLDA